jgi:hypothetical protein
MNKPVPPRQLLQLAGEVISRGGHFSFHPTGHSMYPAIAHGDRVILGPLLEGAARVGDVVLAETQEGPRLHRVISIGTKSSGPDLLVRGDAEAGPGERVRPEAVCGRVVRVHRPLRRWLSPRFWITTLRRIRSRMYLLP